MGTRGILADLAGTHVLLGNVRVQIEKLSGRPHPKSVTTPTVEVERSGDTKVGVGKGRVSVANLTDEPWRPSIR